MVMVMGTVVRKEPCEDVEGGKGGEDVSGHRAFGTTKGFRDEVNEASRC